jgi:hypothetical protein
MKANPDNIQTIPEVHSSIDIWYQVKDLVQFCDVALRVIIQMLNYRFFSCVFSRSDFIENFVATALICLLTNYHFWDYSISIIHKEKSSTSMQSLR